MRLYKISQTVNFGWDTFDSAIVAASSLANARLIHPENKEWNSAPADERLWSDGVKHTGWVYGVPGEDVCSLDGWAPTPNDVKVELIGFAVDGTKAGVIIASFKAG